MPLDPRRPLALVAFLFTPTLALASVTDAIIPIGVVATVFGFISIMVGIIAYATFRARQLRYEAIRLAIEKGQPVVPSLVSAEVKQDPQRDLRRGLLLVAVGAGVSTYLSLSPPQGAPAQQWAIGFVPGFLGISYLVSFALSRRPATRGEADGG